MAKMYYMGKNDYYYKLPFANNCARTEIALIYINIQYPPMPLQNKLLDYIVQFLFKMEDL